MSTREIVTNYIGRSFLVIILAVASSAKDKFR